MPDANEVLKSIRKTLRWLVAATVVLYLSFAGIAIYNFVTNRDQQAALCELRTSMKVEARASKDYLRYSSPGTPIGARVRANYRNQLAGIAALNTLSC